MTHPKQTIPPPAPDEHGESPVPKAAASDEAPAGPTAIASRESAVFEIDWFDEARQPPSGQLFSEPPPEPPTQPFEIVHEPRTRPQQVPTATSGHEAASPPAAYPALWIRWLWGFMPLLLLILGYGSVILTQAGIGHAWDEAYYYDPSLNAADWLTEVVRGNHPFSREAIDKYWEGLHEHPSVQKFVSGIALRVFSAPEEQLRAMRLPIAILFGLSLSLIYLLGRRAWGPMPGLIAALLYATLPRIFGHAHFASMETPLVFMMLLVVFCFLRGLDSPWWAAMTGVSFGMLLATKINGFFLPIPLVLWAQLYARRRYINNLFAMLLLGPLVFVAAWPWLWHDTVMRTLNYLAFHARHQQTALYFLGKVWGYGNTNAPWYYPAVMVLVSLPLTALVLIAWGVLRTALALPRRPVGTLYLFCALVMLGVASAPSTPRYDGVRLFLPVFPFLALLGGAGAAGLISRVQKLVADAGRLRWFPVALAAIVFLDGASSIGRYHPYELSYFNALVGGLRGAVNNWGFETTYWGEALNEDVITVINNLPDGSRLDPLALHELSLQHLQLWTLIKPGIRIGGPPPYDYHLLLMRRGFFQRPERALAGSRRFPIVQSWGKWDVPFIALYQTGLPFEQYWPTLPPNTLPPAAEVPAANAAR